MYEEFFGLTEKPFSIQPDPSFLYWGRGHRLAYAMLEYGVLNHAGISVITGEVGCGKTTLIHRLLDQLSDTHAVALLSNIQQGRGDLLSWVLMGFGRPFAGKTHVELFAEVQQFFIGEYAKGRRIVLIIDEAQNLSVDQLEELRMLSNINAGKDQLLQLILVGQPQLKEILNRPEMLQLAQRVGADFHLTPLSREEVDAYIDTRLTIAGASARIFLDEAVDIVAEHSRGVPRVINIICDTALVYAFSSHEKTVSAQTVENVIRDKSDYGVFGLASESRPTTRPPGEASVATSPPPLLVNEDPLLQRSKRAETTHLRAVSGKMEARRPAPTPSRPREADHQATAPLATAGAAPRAAPAAIAPEAAKPETRPTLPQRVAETPIPAARPSTPPPAARPKAPVAPADAIARAANVQPIEPPKRETVIGVIVVAGARTPDLALSSTQGARAAVFVAQSTDRAAIEAAKAAGAEVVEVGDRALTSGRARNAGYRQLKKRLPQLTYVQFIDADCALHADWLAVAARFMDRRPEVAAIEGTTRLENEELSPFAAIAALELNGEAGEAETIGSTIFVRADAFESAGGFRGDLLVNETRDLCVRLRRRGAHIWRLDAPMALAGPRAGDFNAWWNEGIMRGYEFAHGAALHGAPPDRLFFGERLRAVIWGGLLPALILGGALFGAVVVTFLSPLSNPLMFALAVFGLGAILYAIKIVIAAAERGGKPDAWAFGLWSTIGRFAEAVGVSRYFLGATRAK